MNPNKYPEMTVEKREGRNHHNLRPPTKVGTPEYREQMQDTLILAGHCESEYFPREVKDILLKHAPEAYATPANIKRALEMLSDMGFSSWKSICDLCRDDECVEYFVMIVKYCRKRYAVQPDKKQGFINGQGFGIYRRYIDRAIRTTEQVFDQKYFFKRTENTKRPLEVLHEQTGLDFSSLARYVHPGHPRYPAGHRGKFAEATDTVFDEFEIPEDDYPMFILADYIAAMGRSGILVHLPEDNVASGRTADLPGHDEYKG